MGGSCTGVGRRCRARPSPDYEPLPIFYFTELMALAYGLPLKKVLGKHLVDPRPLLEGGWDWCRGVRRAGAFNDGKQPYSTEHNRQEQRRAGRRRGHRRDGGGDAPGRAGHRVHLLDAAPAIGGSMHLLDHTFPTNSCGICLMLPHQPAFCPTFECEAQRERPPAALRRSWSSWSGEPGAFSAQVRPPQGPLRGRGPVQRLRRVRGRLPRSPAPRPRGLAVAGEGHLPARRVCGPCPTPGSSTWRSAPAAARAWRPARPAPSTWRWRTGRRTLEVGAVLLTPGFAPFDARVKGEYGYGVYDNVLSALEFERMVSLAGSSVAHLARPSDGQAAEAGRLCALRRLAGQPVRGGPLLLGVLHVHGQAGGAGQAAGPRAGGHRLYMDLRAFGKDFEAYMEGVQALPGVTYRRAMPSSVHQVQQTRDLAGHLRGRGWQAARGSLRPAGAGHRLCAAGRACRTWPASWASG